MLTWLRRFFAPDALDLIAWAYHWPSPIGQRFAIRVKPASGQVVVTLYCRGLTVSVDVSKCRTRHEVWNALTETACDLDHEVRLMGLMDGLLGEIDIGPFELRSPRHVGDPQ